MILGLLTYVKSQEGLDSKLDESQPKFEKHRHPASSNLDDLKKNQLKLVQENENTNQNSKDESSVQSLEDLLEQLRKDIAQFHQCLDQGQCEYEGNDPREEELVSSKNLSIAIDQFAKNVVKNQWKSSEISSLGRDLLKFDDGGIKEEALKLLLSQNPEHENVEAVVEGVLKYHDGNLVDQAIQELQRHLKGSEASLIHEGVKECLLTGSLLVKENLSGKMSQLMSPSSYVLYHELSNNPSLDRIVKRNLKSNLSEFEFNQNGG